MAIPPISVKRFRLIYFSCWIGWLLLHAWLLTRLGFDLRIAFTDSIINNALLMAASVILSNNLGYYRPQEGKYYYLVAWGIGLVAVCTALGKWLLVHLFAQQAPYVNFFSMSVPFRVCIGILLIGFTALVSILWYNLEEQKENDQRKTTAEKLSKEAELYTLRQQLQPHFLFNSLNSISALVGTQPEQARRMIQQLSDFLRGTIKKDDQAWIAFPEELQYLQLYLEIEKVRFGHRLSTDIISDESSQAAIVPPLLLQPIVENAIKFGLYDTTGNVRIRITATIQEQELVLTVSNPYDPETATPRRGTGFGLSSVQRRLYLLFARNDLLTTEASGELFTTTVKIPQTND